MESGGDPLCFFHSPKVFDGPPSLFIVIDADICEGLFVEVHEERAQLPFLIVRARL